MSTRYYNPEIGRFLNADNYPATGVCITYSDGAFELVGEKSVYYETLDGEWTYPSYDMEYEAYINFLSAWKAM